MFQKSLFQHKIRMNKMIMSLLGIASQLECLPGFLLPKTEYWSSFWRNYFIAVTLG